MSKPLDFCVSMTPCSVNRLLVKLNSNNIWYAQTRPFERPLVSYIPRQPSINVYTARPLNPNINGEHSAVPNYSSSSMHMHPGFGLYATQKSQTKCECLSFQVINRSGYPPRSFKKMYIFQWWIIVRTTWITILITIAIQIIYKIIKIY